MAVKSDGRERRDEIVITATGSQKGDLDPSQICFLSATETDYGYYKASSETDIHQRILSLPGVGASMHAHTKDLDRHPGRCAQTGPAAGFHPHRPARPVRPRGRNSCRLVRRAERLAGDGPGSPAAGRPSGDHDLRPRDVGPGADPQGSVLPSVRRQQRRRRRRAAGKWGGRRRRRRGSRPIPARLPPRRPYEVEDDDGCDFPRKRKS